MSDPVPDPARLRVRAFPLVLVGLLVAGCAAVLLLRELSVLSPLAIAVVSLTPFVAVAALVALLLAVLSRSRVAIIAAAAVLVAAVATQAPLVIASPAGSGGVPIIMMTANLKFGSADAAAIVANIRDNHVDVAAFEELTPEEVARLQSAGLEQVLPYSFAEASWGPQGTGLWSRWPLTDGRQLPGYHFNAVTATVRPPGIAPLRLVAAHIFAPVNPPASQWADEMALLGRQVPAGDGPVMIGGDFNATMDHAPFRALLRTGYSDAIDQSGGGLRLTFPAGMAVPPLIGIDHVLTGSGVWCASTHTVTSPGSDHRGLVAQCFAPALTP